MTHIKYKIEKHTFNFSKVNLEMSMSFLKIERIFHDLFTLNFTCIREIQWLVIPLHGRSV
jgi:hypothetical protein